MQKSGKIILVSILVMLACISIVAAVEPGTTSGHGINPVLSAGNVVKCADAGCDGTTLLIDKNDGESYTGSYCIDATHCIAITANKVMGATDENSIDWRANFDVGCVVMKGSNGYDTYYCTYANKNDDTKMSTPINPSGKPAGISHILICYTPPDNYPAPEFPTLALPVALLVGFVGAVQYIRIRKE